MNDRSIELGLALEEISFNEIDLKELVDYVAQKKHTSKALRYSKRDGYILIPLASA